MAINKKRNLKKITSQKKLIKEFYSNPFNNDGRHYFD